MARLRIQIKVSIFYHTMSNFGRLNTVPTATFESYKIREDESHRRDQYHDSESLQKHHDVGLSYRKNKVNFFKTKKQEKRQFCNCRRRLYP